MLQRKPEETPPSPHPSCIAAGQEEGPRHTAQHMDTLEGRQRTPACWALNCLMESAFSSSKPPTKHPDKHSHGISELRAPNQISTILTWTLSVWRHVLPHSYAALHSKGASKWWCKKPGFYALKQHRGLKKPGLRFFYPSASAKGAASARSCCALCSDLSPDLRHQHFL